MIHKIKVFFKEFNLIPLKTGNVILHTSKNDFFHKLKLVTEKSWSLSQALNPAGQRYEHEYQSDINRNNFWLRPIEAYEGSNGYRRPNWVGNLIYCKIIENKEDLTFRYSVIPDTIGFIIFLVALTSLFFGIYFSITREDYSLIFIGLSFYLLVLIRFDYSISRDLYFVNWLIKLNNKN